MNGNLAKDLTLAVIGCGSMGTAILSGILKSCSNQANISQDCTSISKFIACVQSKASAERLEIMFSEHSHHLSILCDDNLSAFRAANIALLACKPYMAKSVLDRPGVKEALDGKLVVSVLAGTSSTQLLDYIYGESSSLQSPSCCIMRAVPNMAAQIGKSITLVATTSALPPQDFADITHWIFSQIGQVSYISEDLFEAGSILSGATGAFFTVAFDGILDGAVSQGINRERAKEILAKSLLGLAKLIESGEHPALLRESIASPKGTTIEGLMVLERGGTRSTFTDAFISASQRSQGLK